MSTDDPIVALRASKAHLERALADVRRALHFFEGAEPEYRLAVIEAERLQKVFFDLRRPLLDDVGSAVDNATSAEARANADAERLAFVAEFVDWIQPIR